MNVNVYSSRTSPMVPASSLWMENMRRFRKRCDGVRVNNGILSILTGTKYLLQSVVDAMFYPVDLHAHESCKISLLDRFPLLTRNRVLRLRCIPDGATRCNARRAC
jgi:hypothetical protein